MRKSVFIFFSMLFFVVVSYLRGEISIQPISGSQPVVVSLPASLTSSCRISRDGFGEGSTAVGQGAEKLVVLESKPIVEGLLADDLIPLAEEVAHSLWSGTISIPDTGSWVGVWFEPVDLPSGPYVTGVQVHHEITHTYIGDLQVKLYNELTSHEWVIRNNEGGSADNIDETVMEDLIFDGDDPNQNWYYAVRDTYTQDVGTLDVVELWVYYDTNPSTAPDLTPYQPVMAEAGIEWNDKIPISTTQLLGNSDHNDNGPYLEGQTLYVNWASLNQGNSDASAYVVRLEVTGDGGGIWDMNVAETPLSSYAYLTNDFAVGPLGAGNHTFKLWVDYYDTTSEVDENNNYYGSSE